MRWHIHKWQYWWYGTEVGYDEGGSHRVCSKCGRRDKRVWANSWTMEFDWVLESITPKAKAHITEPRPKYEYTWHPRCF